MNNSVVLGALPINIEYDNDRFGRKTLSKLRIRPR